jgi:hypothetical protein
MRSSMPIAQRVRIWYAAIWAFWDKYIHSRREIKGSSIVLIVAYREFWDSLSCQITLPNTFSTCVTLLTRAEVCRKSSVINVNLSVKDCHQRCSVRLSVILYAIILRQNALCHLRCDSCQLFAVRHIVEYDVKTNLRTAWPANANTTDLMLKQAWIQLLLRS